MYGNVGGGVFSLFGDTIIFRFKRLLLRKPCHSPLSTTTAFPPREYSCECVCRWREKKGKDAAAAATTVRRWRICRRPSAPYVGGGELRKPWTTGGLGARERGFYFVSLAASLLSLSSLRARARPSVCLPASPVARPPSLCTRAYKCSLFGRSRFLEMRLAMPVTGSYTMIGGAGRAIGFLRNGRWG